MVGINWVAALGNARVAVRRMSQATSLTRDDLGTFQATTYYTLFNTPQTPAILLLEDHLSAMYTGFTSALNNTLDALSHLR